MPRSRSAGTTGCSTDGTYAIGNITAKTSSTDPSENVGTYTYHATKKHAVVSTSNGWSFGYDANGNMNSYKGNSISWTSYNLPVTINGAGQSSQFAYGPNRNRWRQIASCPSGTETTIYVGGILEKVTVPSGTAYRHTIGAGSAKVIYTRWSTGTINTKYVTADHLGSSTVVMDGSGAALASLSFGSYGARRGSAWTGAPSAGDWTQISNSTRQGFTGHEGLDNVNFVHMNGRVFEPVLGRFISADPFMPGSLGSQAPNRFAYVGNRPQSLIDPSGFNPPDVTESEPTPRIFPQCPYQIANIAVDCPYNYGWRWGDRDPIDLWLWQEYRDEAWARWMTETNGGGRIFNPPPRTAQDSPTRPEYLPSDEGQEKQQQEPQDPLCHKPLPDGGTVSNNVQYVQQGIAMMQQTGNSAAHATMLLIWLQNVAPGGAWDYKLSGQPGSESMGNFNFGATGTTFFGPTTLLSGAGVVQLMTKPSNSSGGIPFVTPPYGDEIGDQGNIQAGINGKC